MKLKEKLFPAKDPAIIKIYGRFNCDLEERVRRQMKEVFAKKEKPDGLILLINSTGGSTRTLTKFTNGLLKLGLPCMGFVEDEALSSGAELLLSCQYRVATPFAKICFHHGSVDIDIDALLDPEILMHISADALAQKKIYLERFSRATGQTIDNTRTIYRADSMISAVRAVELGILHETTEKIFPCSPEELF
ncbi:MAG: hypothetical protein A2937_02455 [Candidatus Yonathbacteria bacterium RIFCSPLOWO2_01_FULL_47_33b]|uniref:ATP-dependent Clp protease proteolytic subunit n=1 Tax=Candidatus Yonathbacteria bacterium RIFCSPLOWO2_01_FULL_47_33b TaxID=1802727 RepID=A0A1G2SI18_9BACT|nr:MAG: hypothetical protein A2937_02455 [Candidatus Yonathbacteria bacterium RIFCSPLOWO2_01_FULL_47_33b]